MKRIYIVEDEKTLSNLLETYLIDDGYHVKVFNDGLSAKDAILDNPDLWVLDIMLPKLNGYALIKDIKAKTPKIPVIFMSARSAELDRVIGLEMGSDDYLAKPFLPRELVLRVNRLLKNEQKTPSSSVSSLGPYIFDQNRRQLILDESIYSLSVKEYELLNYFLNNIDNALSRTEILDHVWGTDYFGSDRVIDDSLRRLRKKVPLLPIETVYGYGYMLTSKTKGQS